MVDFMSEFTNEIYDVSDKEAGELCPMSVFLGILVTLLPKVVPRVMPLFMPTTDQSVRERLDTPEYQEELEEMFRVKFAENLELVERILLSIKEDPAGLEKADPTTREGFLRGALSALGVTDMTDGLETGSLRRLARIATGEGTGSQVYSLIADVIVFLGESLVSYFV